MQASSGKTFKNYSRVLLIGHSGSGKTHLIINILKHHAELFESPIKGVVWVAGVQAMPSIFLNIPIRKIQVNDDIEEIVSSKEISDHIVILDDLQFQADRLINDIFCKYSRHLKYHVFVMQQTMFGNTRFSRSISLNANYLIIFRNRRDQRQINILASQLLPSNTKFILDAYKKATNFHYGYLFIDLSVDSSEILRYKGNIIPGDFPLQVFIPLKTAAL